MDLLEMLKQEINELGLTSKYSIARYIYIRTGELFDYDPLYEIVDQQEQMTYINKEVDYRNVTDFHVVCYSWASMYANLLKEFEIDAKVKNGFCHKYVVYSIDDKFFKADITAEYEDISRIKFGLNIENNYQLGVTEDEKKELNSKIDEEINYNKGICTEEVLSMIKDELKNTYKKDADYAYNVFNTIRDIINVHRDGVGYISGRMYIRNLLDTFLDESDKECSARIYNNDGEFIQVYKVNTSKDTHYFLYHKMMNGYFELNEANKEIVEFFINSKTYESKYTKNLHLAA